MSDLNMHKKSLDNLVDYYENEQWCPDKDTYYIVHTCCTVLEEMSYLKTHLLYEHDNADGRAFLDYITIQVKAVTEDKVAAIDFRNYIQTGAH